MTRKDFSLIADTIYHLPMTEQTRDIVAANFARVLEDYNPRFDSYRFLQACRNGLTPKELARL